MRAGPGRLQITAMSDPAGTPSERARERARAASDEPRNFVEEFYESATPEELRMLDELAELDRKHGNKPTPE